LAPLCFGLLLQAGPSRADKPVGTATSDASAATAPTTLAPKLDLEGPEAEAKDRARVLFQRGVAAYRAGKFYDAVDVFLETQRLYPDTQLCFNVARAYENLGDESAALRYYRDYLRQADRPSDGAEVRDRVRRLEQQLAQRGAQQLTVLSQPEGATVLLDGKPVGITPWTGDTYPGKHRLALALERHAGQEQIIELDAHAARDVSFALVPLPAPKPVPAVPPPLVSPKQPGVSLETLVTLGTGLALLSGAIVAEAASQEAGLSRSSAFLAGGGLGVSGVGGVMLYFDLSPHSSAARSAPLRQKDSAAARP
jgi:tetratricopeptide (TPR) repeat protein